MHANLPGRYRFFLDVTLGDLRIGDNVRLMTEFVLSDDKQELAHATKTPIPEYILQGISEQEYLIQKERELEQELETKVFVVVEQMPEFPGGLSACMSYIARNVKYPTIALENGIQGRVVVQFCVEKDGSISNTVATKSVNPYLDKEALRVVSSMPKWTPGKQKGKPVRVKYTLPVHFRLK